MFKFRISDVALQSGDDGVIAAAGQGKSGDAGEMDGCL